MTVPMLMPNGPAAAIGMALGAKGGARTAVSACASGNEAIATLSIGFNEAKQMW